MPVRVVSVSQKLLISWDFHAQYELAVNSAKKQKNIISRLKCIVNETGQRRKARLIKADRKVTVMQITTHCNSGMQKSISEHTKHIKPRRG